jgi:hypothetical protein
VSEEARVLAWVVLWVVVGAAGGGLIGLVAFAIDDNLCRGRKWWRLW